MPTPFKIKESVNLQTLNTFGFKVHARYFAEVTSTEQLQALLQDSWAQRTRKLVLGCGSNILFTHDFDGLVIKMNIQGMQISRRSEHQVWMRAGAGVLWHDLVQYSLSLGLGGLENLSLIPGTVGAAPIQNIGAYGAEIKDVIDHLEALDMRTSECHVFTHEECAFGYRNSVFKNPANRDQYVIVHVTLKLSKTPSVNASYAGIQNTLNEMGITKPTIHDVSNAVVKIRQSKIPDPSVIGSAGSFFKNPLTSTERFESLRERYAEIIGYPKPNNMVLVPAGWLIEQCGWKGKKVGGVGVHENHALVLVNYGTGNGQKLYKLSLDISKSVNDYFGIELTPEVIII